MKIINNIIVGGVIIIYLLLVASTANAHRCIHDEEILPMLKKNPPVTLPQYYPDGVLKHGTHGPPINVDVKKSPDGTFEYKEFSIDVHHHHHDHKKHREAKAQSATQTIANETNSKPMRFTISTLDLYNSSRYCTEVGQFRPSFKGDELNCSGPEFIFTPEKRDKLVNYLIPLAIQNISRLLQVVPFKQSIVGLTQGLCGPFTIPQDHIDNGVSDTDYILYVAAGPTPTNNVAWAGMCANDQSGRPIVGRMNCGSNYIDANTDEEVEKYISTATHECLHALGFSADAMNNNFNIPGYTGENVVLPGQIVRGGLEVSLVTSPHVKSAARKFYGCDSYAGMEREAFGGPGTENSHWSRLLAMESCMAGVQGEINRVDNLTISLFADMQYYFPNFTFVESMYYGNNTGCGFLTEKCSSTSMSMKAQNLFCANHTTDDTMCTYNMHGIGKCQIATYSGDLPEWGQYYPSNPRLGGTTSLMQYCPFVGMFSNNKCRIGNLSSGTTNTKILGYTYGAGGRCIAAASLIQVGYATPTAYPARCLIHKCLRQETPWGLKYRLQITVRADATVNCSEDGAAGNVNAPPGWTGILPCPSAYDICPSDSKGWGEDLVYEDLPPITTTTTTTTTITYLTDVNGSTYTLAPPTTVSTTETTVPETTTETSTTTTSSPTSTTSVASTTAASDSGATTASPPNIPTSNPNVKYFTITLGDATLNNNVLVKTLSLVPSSLTLALTNDIQASVSSATVQSVTTTSDNKLLVTVDISNSAQLNTFSNLIADGNTDFLESTAFVMATASGDDTITSSSLAISASASAGTTTLSPSNAAANNTSDNPAYCFISGQECYVSYAVMGAGALLIILFVVYVTKKKNNGGNNNGGHGGTEREKWNREYGMQNAPANNRRSSHHADAPVLSHMDREMEMHQQYHQRQQQQAPRRGVAYAEL